MMKSFRTLSLQFHLDKAPDSSESGTKKAYMIRLSLFTTEVYSTYPRSLVHDT